MKVGDLVEVLTITRGENLGIIVDISTIGGLRGTRQYWINLPTRPKTHAFRGKQLKVINESR